MLTRRLAAVIVAAALITIHLLALDASATQEEDFAFINNASSAITEVYLTDPDSEDWGNDLISSLIRPGETRGFVFTPEADLCIYDIHASFEDGTPVQLYGWDLCQSPYIEFVTE